MLGYRHDKEAKVVKDRLETAKYHYESEGEQYIFSCTNLIYINICFIHILLAIYILKQ